MINYKNQFSFLILAHFFLAIVLSFLFIGFENFNFTNIQWLFSGSDISAHQTGWNFFKNDNWRFPLGNNPNYGDDIGNSIVYSDSIPLLALIFKSFNFLLPNNFQYFGIWFFLCFYLQGLLSYLLIQKYTNDKIYSFIGSIFFVSLPIFIYRMGFHPALSGQWTLIITIYLMLEKDKVREKYWVFLILITSLIHFYFTVINLIIYNFFKIFSLLFSKDIKFKKYFKDILFCHSALIVLMYCIGYFEVRLVDTLALGFGVYKLNILSLIDALNSSNGVSWSWFLPDINLTNGEEIEGFNFVGLGILILFLSIIIKTLINKNQKKYLISLLDKKSAIILFLIFLLSLSNRISFGSSEIFVIPLYDFFYGLLSTIRSSGRLFWLVSYFILFISLFSLYNNFGKNKSIFFVTLLLSIQLIDISAGLKDYIKLNRFINNDFILKDSFWYEQTTSIENIMTTKPNNYNKNFNNLAYYINDKNFKKTNIVKTARIDRNKAALSRYKLNADFIKKKIDSKTIYIVDNIGHLLTLKEIFKDENVGFFFRDGIWSMIKGQKKKMNDNDELELTKISTPKINKRNNILKENSNFLGLGWTHNFNKGGVWSEGDNSNLLFRINNQESDFLILEFLIEPFINEKISELNLDIYTNEVFNSSKKFTYQRSEIQENSKIELKIQKDLIRDGKININFINKNPKSPLDILKSPDSRKIGFLLKEIKLIN